ncbi:hypothetical protein JOM56_012214 [Amanita muscaria]
MRQSYGGPKITKGELPTRVNRSRVYSDPFFDCVTVAKSITLKDKFENLGARLVQDVAQKTNEIAGDGQLATVLTRTIYSEGVKNIAARCDSMDLRCGAQASVERVVDYLAKHVKTSWVPSAGTSCSMAIMSTSTSSAVPQT